MFIGRNRGWLPWLPGDRNIVVQELARITGGAWPSNKGIAAVDLNADSATRAAFSRAVLRKSAAEVTSYWQQQIFSGRAVPPVVKKSDAEVVAFVEGNEGAIGYVSDGADTGAAKVIRVVE
jgi:ABC-type phosphate transport system substrate-binding protein